MICFFKPILDSTTSSQGIHFSIFSLQILNSSLKKGMNLFKRCHLSIESIKFKNEESLQGLHNSSVSIHFENSNKLYVILPKWYLLVYWKGVGMAKWAYIFAVSQFFGIGCVGTLAYHNGVSNLSKALN